MKKNGSKLTLYIFLSMIVGDHCRLSRSYQCLPGIHQEVFYRILKLLTNIFLRLVQMIIAPLVFSTLVVGIAKLGDLKTVGRIGGKAMLWFITASLISLLIGLVLGEYSETR